MKKQTADKTADDATKEHPETENAAEESTGAETEAAAGDGNAGTDADDAAENAAAENAAADTESGEADTDAAEQEDAGGDADTRADGEKGGFFGRKKKKDKKDELIEELTDRVKRTMAEFENFRKRNEREKSQMYEMGARDIIEKMLPVLDNFERGLVSIPEDQKDNAVAQGMEMIYKQMLTVFDQIGVKEIEAEGKEFDPDFHNAVMHEESEEAGENVITQVFQKGYTYRDTVIRHSMVKVAN